MSKKAKVIFKFVLYNPKTNDIGVATFIGGRLFVDTMYPGGYRPAITGNWVSIGYL